jgi:hypothetical protein
MGGQSDPPIQFQLGPQPNPPVICKQQLGSFHWNVSHIARISSHFHLISFKFTISIDLYEAFTKVLSCLCRYGDETVIRATPEELSLAVVGVNQTSYCRFTFLRNFFERGYRVSSKSSRGLGWRNVSAVIDDSTDRSTKHYGMIRMLEVRKTR